MSGIFSARGVVQREAAKLIRESGADVSILSDRALAEMWGLYSCETANRFWKPCHQDEVSRFVAWANGKPGIRRELAKAKHEAVRRKNEREEARQARPSAHFVLAWDGQRIADPTIRAGRRAPVDICRATPEPLMTVHELVDSVNQWCSEQQVFPASLGSKALVDVPWVRYCCKYSLLDRPGSPANGRRRGFSQKHACQLRTIRLLQARSLCLADINTILHGRTLPQLREIEHEELCLLHGVVTHDFSESSPRRTRTPRWA